MEEQEKRLMKGLIDMSIGLANMKRTSRISDADIEVD